MEQEKFNLLPPKPKAIHDKDNRKAFIVFGNAYREESRFPSPLRTHDGYVIVYIKFKTALKEARKHKYTEIIQGTVSHFEYVAINKKHIYTNYRGIKLIED